MAIPRTSLLDLPLPVTGSLSGDWGAATNNGLTEYLDIAVAGSLVLNTDADVTLTSTDGDENGTNIGSTTAQYAILRWTATGSTTRNITVPAKSKTYIVINATGGTQSIVLRGAGPTTGVTIVSGEKAVCAWNGSDFVKVGGAAGGTNTQVQYNNNGVFGGVSGATTNGTAITFSTTNLKLQGSSTGVSSFASANSSATDYTVTFPAASTTIPVATQTLTFSGPTAARTITLPDANFTAARTDSAQTFTGVQTFSSDASVNGITVGRGAGAVSTNTVVGASALAVNTSGAFNVAIGQSALAANTTATQNVAIGYEALLSNTTGGSNVAVGLRALKSNTTNAFNVAIGVAALEFSTGDSNTVVGYQAGKANTTGQNLAAFGVQAGFSNTTGSYNAFFGTNSARSNTTGSNNVAVGEQSLYSNTTASNNTAVGYQALYNSTNADNTSLGYQAGDVITTGTGNVIIGKGADPSVNSATDQIVIGNGVTGQANTNVTIGNATGKIYNAYTVNATWTQTSDGTMKNVIGPDSLGLSFINRLNPILFTWKAQNDLPPDHPYYAEENKRDTTRVIHGFVAQEVKAALDAEGCSTFNGWDQGDDGIQAISREMFISPLVKAIQELSAQVEQLKAELAALKGA